MSGLASSPDVRAGSSFSGQLPEIATGCCRPVWGIRPQHRADSQTSLAIRKRTSVTTRRFVHRLFGAA